MKIGISLDPKGNSYARFGERKYEKIAAHGFRSVDYSMADTRQELYERSAREAERMLLAERAAAESAGVEIFQVHGPWRYPPCDATEEDRRERMDKMKRSMDLTYILGCKNWVVHPLMPFGTHDLELGEERRTWEWNLEFLSRLLDHAKGLDLTVCLENMPMQHFSLARPSEVLALVRELNDERCKICLDTGHVAVFPDLNPADTVRLVGRELRVLHVHDNPGNKDAHLWPTKGIIDWAGFVSALREIGFEGAFSLETLRTGDPDDTRFEAECIQLYKIAKSLLA